MTTTRKAKRAYQVDEEIAGTGRNVKRRAERNEEILKWRKLKARLTPQTFLVQSPYSFP